MSTIPYKDNLTNTVFVDDIPTSETTFYYQISAFRKGFESDKTEIKKITGSYLRKNITFSTGIPILWSAGSDGKVFLVKVVRLEFKGRVACSISHSELPASGAKLNLPRLKSNLIIFLM